MPTAFNVLLQTARNLEALIDGVATANGTTTTLIDSGLIVGRENDEFNGGTLFLISDTGSAREIVDETVTTLAGVFSFSDVLAYHPVNPGDVVLTTPLTPGVMYDILSPGIMRSFASGSATESIPAYMWNDSILQHHALTTPAIPRSMSFTISFSDHDDIVLTDTNGDGILYTGGGSAEGSINYDNGIWSLTLDITGMSVTGTEITYLFYEAYGTIDYASGAITIQFNEAQTGAVTASYHYTPSAFLPLIAAVTDFSSTTGTVTYAQASAPPVTGTSYAVVYKRYPVWLLLQKLNEVLNEINDYVSTRVIRTSELNNYEVGLEYWARVLHVWQGYDLNQNDPKRWQPVTNYTRANGVIRLEGGVRGDTVIIETVGTHPAVTALDSISDTYSLEWLALATAVKCCRWRLLQPGSDDRLITIQLNDLMAREQRAMRNRRWMPPLAVVASPTAWPEA